MADDRLVTLATLTYAKAQILQNVLNNEGISSALFNVNVIQPMASYGVKVRIHEKDLERASQILESGTWLSDAGENIDPESKTVLLPVDFSDYTLKTCRFAFDYADRIGGNVILFHVFFPPIYSSMLPQENEVNSIEEYNMVMKEVREKMDALIADIEELIKAGKMPICEYKEKIYEGVSEEEILHVAAKIHPAIILMGTKGRHRDSESLIGSVTAEVIERSKDTVVAIPESVRCEDFSGIRHVAFMTNFDPRDLEAFESLYRFVKPLNAKITIIHLDSSGNEWNEIKLNSIKEYLKKRYSDLELGYKLLPYDGLLRELDEFVKKEAIDAISLSKYRKNVFARLFNPSMAKRMLFHTDTPLVVINRK